MEGHLIAIGIIALECVLLMGAAKAFGITIADFFGKKPAVKKCGKKEE